jgi:hypothetical protein
VAAENDAIAPVSAASGRVARLFPWRDTCSRDFVVPADPGPGTDPDTVTDSDGCAQRTAADPDKAAIIAIQGASADVVTDKGADHADQRARPDCRAHTVAYAENRGRADRGANGSAHRVA